MIPPRKEGEILAAVMAYLAARLDCHFWRQNVGVVSPRPGAPPVRFGVPGCADILCCQAVFAFLQPMSTVSTVIGRMVGIEVKVPGKGPTPDQIAWGEQLTAAGGLYVVAHSVDEVRAALGEPTVRIPKRPSGRVYSR